MPRVQHFCVGACCEGGQRSVATTRVADLLVEALLRPIAKNIPATNRWHTFSPTLAAQTAARFCHQFLPRLLERGLQPAQPEKAATDGEDEPPFRVYQNRRRRRALEFHLPEETSVTLGVAALVSAPLEKLSKVLQGLGHRLLRCVRNEHTLDQSDAETMGLCGAFFAESDCCLDDLWSAPFRAGLNMAPRTC